MVELTETAERRSKQGAILQTLRSQIVRGEYQPGGRLPTRDQLARSFQASRVTIQKALDRLFEEGFVFSRRRGGTCVTPHPPHLARYALVIPHAPGSNSWVRFWTALCNEANAISSAPGAPGRAVAVYYDITGRADSPDYKKLLRDVEAHRVAGIIFATPPHQLRGTPLLDQRPVPCVAITARADVHGIPGIALDSHSFFDKAMDYLAAKKRKNIAVLTVPGLCELFEDYVIAGLAKRGMSTRPDWTQLATQAVPESARRIVQLLLHDPARRPDGLIITDDNLVEQASAGVISSGLQVPRDLEIVAHCNFPWPAPTVLPVKRLGFDARRVLQAGMASIDQQRAGGEVAQLTNVPAVFEE
jgi:hypothetical protein